MSKYIPEVPMRYVAYRQYDGSNLENIQEYFYTEAEARAWIRTQPQPQPSWGWKWRVGVFE